MVNAVILLFVNDIDEKVFSLVRLLVPSWTSQILEQVDEHSENVNRERGVYPAERDLSLAININRDVQSREEILIYQMNLRLEALEGLCSDTSRTVHDFEELRGKVNYISALCDIFRDKIMRDERTLL